MSRFHVNAWASQWWLRRSPVGQTRWAPAEEGSGVRPRDDWRPPLKRRPVKGPGDTVLSSRNTAASFESRGVVYGRGLMGWGST